MLWRERGIDLIYRAATGGDRLRTVLTALGGTVFLSVLVCSIGLAFFLDRYFRLANSDKSKYSQIQPNTIDKD